jgi:integrase
MAEVNQSAGGGVASDSAPQTGTVETSARAPGFQLQSTCRQEQGLSPLPLRAGHLSIREVIDLYMAHYAGRDNTRVQRLAWWTTRVGDVALQELSDDHVHAALESLASQTSRYYAGKDADGRPVFKPKHKPLASATVNRYAAALGAVLTWTIKRRIAPKGYVHPCRTVERKAENNEKIRFLSDDERKRLLEACRGSRWSGLYPLVLLALTTGARKGELLSLQWADIDLAKALAYCGRTKNGDAKALPLVPGVVDLLRARQGAAASLVFASPRSPRVPYAFDGRWRDAVKQAKLRNFRFHDLRHTCASMLAQNGATLLEIGDVLGHRQLQMTKRYSHLTTGHKAALVNRVLGDIK